VRKSIGIFTKRACVFGARGPVQGPFLAVAAAWLLTLPTTGFTQPAVISLDPRSLDGLVSVWDFQEPGEAPRRDHGQYAFALQDRHGPIERAEEGV